MGLMFLMVRLSRDLEGNHWLQYDKDFWEWAAAKDLKVWGKLNLSIYGRCLPFSNIHYQSQDLTLLDACLRNEPSSKIYRGVTAINGILMVLVKSLLQIADMSMCITIAGRSTELLIVPPCQGKYSSPCRVTALYSCTDSCDCKLELIAIVFIFSVSSTIIIFSINMLSSYQCWQSNNNG